MFQIATDTNGSPWLCCLQKGTREQHSVEDNRSGTRFFCLLSDAVACHCCRGKRGRTRNNFQPRSQLAHTSRAKYFSDVLQLALALLYIFKRLINFPLIAQLTILITFLKLTPFCCRTRIAAVNSAVAVFGSDRLIISTNPNLQLCSFYTSPSPSPATCHQSDVTMFEL